MMFPRSSIRPTCLPAVRHWHPVSGMHAFRSTTSGTAANSDKAVSKIFSRLCGDVQLAAVAGTPADIPALRGLPEIVMIGRANVGKSSLLNAVLGRKDLLYTGKKAGRTRTLNLWRLGGDPGKLVVVDSPGYGAVADREAGRLFDYYVRNRPALRRVYVLLNARHGVTSADQQMLAYLQEQSLPSSPDSPSPARPRFSFQAIATKVDRLLLEPRDNGPSALARMRAQVAQAAPGCLPLLYTAAVEPKIGIEGVRASIAEACSLVDS